MQNHTKAKYLQKKLNITVKIRILDEFFDTRNFFDKPFKQ